LRGAILVLSLGLIGCTKPSGVPQLKANEVLLQVVASGRTDTRPDEARITVGVSNIAATASAASAANAEVMARMTEALARLGVRANDLQTRNLSLGRIDYGPQRGRFRAENLVDVRIKEIARAGEAIAIATDAGGNVVSGPQLRIGDPERGDNAAYAAAYKAARTRADAYAGAAGLRVARVLAIRDGGAFGPPMPYERDAAAVGNVAAQEAAPPPVHAGVSTREVRVRVDFALVR